MSRKRDGRGLRRLFQGRRAAALVAAAVLVHRPLGAQAIPKSQHGIVMQMIGPASVSVAYNRPSARGRQLFGGVVPYGNVWNPGADSATTVTFSKDVLVAGRPLGAGKYSLWMIPEPDGDWTVIFSRAADVFHVPYPAGQDALRVRLRAETGSFSWKPWRSISPSCRRTAPC